MCAERWKWKARGWTKVESSVDNVKLERKNLKWSVNNLQWCMSIWNKLQLRVRKFPEICSNLSGSFDGDFLPVQTFQIATGLPKSSVTAFKAFQTPIAVRIESTWDVSGVAQLLGVLTSQYNRCTATDGRWHENKKLSYRLETGRQQCISL